MAEKTADPAGHQKDVLGKVGSLHCHRVLPPRQPQAYITLSFCCVSKQGHQRPLQGLRRLGVAGGDVLHVGIDGAVPQGLPNQGQVGVPGDQV